MAKREDVPEQNYNCSLKAYFWKKKRLRTWSSGKSLCNIYLVNFFVIVSKINKRRVLPLIWSGSGSEIRDHLDHGRSNDPMNPCPEWIHRFIWSTMIRVISDHWSWSGSSLRNAPEVSGVASQMSHSVTSAWAPLKTTKASGLHG